MLSTTALLTVAAISLLACDVQQPLETTESLTSTPTSPPTTSTPEPTPTQVPAISPTSALMPTRTPTATPTQPPISTSPVAFGPGTYQVGVELQPGLYVGNAGTGVRDSCYWERLSGVSGEFSDIIANDNAIGQFYVEILRTDKYFKIGCDITPFSEWPKTEKPLAAIQAGTYMVGLDIAAGTYKGNAGESVRDSCYWERLNGVSGEFSALIANDNAIGQFYVEILETDRFFSTRCALELTAAPTANVSALPTPRQIPTTTPTPTPTPIPTSVAAPTPAPTPTPTLTPTATPTPTPTPTPTLGPISTPGELVARVQDSIVRVMTPLGSGSGFIYEIEETTAFVATNHHVIDGASEVDVQVRNGQTYKALILGWDADRDVAVLAICCDSYFVALAWDPETPEVGDQVVAVGFPRSSASGLTATTGEVVDPDPMSRQYGFFPHSAPLNPGNSGGPLFSMPDARVLGINTARGLEELSFYSVPLQAVAESIEEWRAQLVIAPAPTLVPKVTYEAVEAGGSSYTVNEIRDPALGEVAVGKRLVAVDITQVGLVDGVSYNPLYFSVQDSNGYVYDLSFASFLGTNVEPSFGYGELGKGQTVRGWVVFELPESATLSGILLSSVWGPTTVIADID